jgi:PAS domain S-box-containing protein
VRPRTSSTSRDEAAAIAPLDAYEWIAISRAVDTIFQTAHDEPTFARVLALLLEQLDSQAGAFGYIDEFGELALPFELGFESVDNRTPNAGPLPPEDWEGAWGMALQERRVETQNQAATEGRTKLQARRGIAAPILFGQQLIGLLYAANKPSDYDALDAARIGLIAQRVAPVLSSWLAHRRFRRELSDAEEMAAAAAEGERFFMMSRDLMTITDARIRRTNPAFWNLLGWEDHELRDKSIADLTHPADRSLLEQEFVLMRTEPNREHTPVSVQMLTKAGDSRRIEWVGAATEEGRVYAVGRDVSALSQAVEKLAIQNDELQRMHDQARDEERMAGQLLANVRRQGCLDAPGIRYIASPLGFFNGDVALAAFTPSGELRWMLGDFTGHGLSAAIGTIPVAGAFYSSCRQGATLIAAIASINDLLKSLLPAGLFCAAGFLSLSTSGDVLSVWNSALPPIVLRRVSDGQVSQYASQSLPLGLVTSRELDIQPTQVPVQIGDDVLIFSDGLSEAANARGELFGVGRIQQALQSVTKPGDGFDAVVNALAGFRGAVQANDDVSLVSVTVGHTRTLTVGVSP